MHSSLVGLKNLTGTAHYIHTHLGGKQVRRDHPVYSLAYPVGMSGVADVEIAPPPSVYLV